MTNVIDYAMEKSKKGYVFKILEDEIERKVEIKGIGKREAEAFYSFIKENDVRACHLVDVAEDYALTMVIEVL